MKVRMFSTTTEGIIFLKLEESGDGVNLVAVDSTGERLLCGLILNLSCSGLLRYRGVETGLGFPLDSGSRVKEVK